MISMDTDNEHYREHLAALARGERTGMMRIMRWGMPDDCPTYIRMDALNEEWARKNHDQSLAQLNERGGISPDEAAAIIQMRPWKHMREEVAVDSIRPYALDSTDRQAGNTHESK